MNFKITRRKIDNNLYITIIENEKFRHNRLTVNFIEELSEQNVCANAFISQMLKHGGTENKDFCQLNLKLNDLYGAELTSGISKYGKYQVADVSVISLDDEYALSDNEEILKKSAEILCSAAFNSMIKSESFTEGFFKNEQTYLIDTIKSAINDKQFYALFKCKEQLCKGEPYSISEYGKICDAEQLTIYKIREGYERLLEKSRIEIMFVGKSYSFSVEDIIKTKLPKRNAEELELNNKVNIRNITNILIAKENMQLSQEKLVMGFDFSEVVSEIERNSIRLFAYIFGNSPDTGLFTAIREKLKLCYYCGASADIMSGTMLVECGIDSENHQKAVSEILKEFKKYQRNGITEEELYEAKLALIGEITEVKNFINMTEDWYINQIISCQMNSPDEQIENINKIDTKDVLNAIRKLKYVSLFALD